MAGHTWQVLRREYFRPATLADHDFFRSDNIVTWSGKAFPPGLPFPGHD